MSDPPQFAVITGGARRIGAALARALHHRGVNVIIQFRSSRSHVDELCAGGFWRARSANLARQLVVV